MGVYLGKFMGRFVGKYADIVGGGVLILIGTKILLQHLGIYWRILRYIYVKVLETERILLIFV